MSFDGAGAHFERSAEIYERARPPYPDQLYARLVEHGVTGPDVALLEIGGGTGEATVELAQVSRSMTVIEPGPSLAARLRTNVPSARVVTATFESAWASGQLSTGGFDSICIATAFHWLDHSIALPAMHRLLRPRGMLAVWRHVFGTTGRSPTPFRRRIAEIVDRRDDSPDRREHHRTQLDWRGQLLRGGWFEPVHYEVFDWEISADASQIQDLFSTFSDWASGEVAEAAAAVDELGGTVVEHYRTTLAIARARDGEGSSRQP